jgi:hypothetical protein
MAQPEPEFAHFQGKMYGEALSQSGTKNSWTHCLFTTSFIALP